MESNLTPQDADQPRHATAKAGGLETNAGHRQRMNMDELGPRYEALCNKDGKYRALGSPASMRQGLFYMPPPNASAWFIRAPSGGTQNFTAGSGDISKAIIESHLMDLLPDCVGPSRGSNGEWFIIGEGVDKIEDQPTRIAALMDFHERQVK